MRRYASFAASRLGWAVDPACVYPIPDVMTGLAEVVAGRHPTRLGDRHQPPGLPAVLVPVRVLRAADHRGTAGPRPRMAGTTWTRRPSMRRSASRAPPLTCCAARTTRPATCGRLASWRWWPTCASAWRRAAGGRDPCPAGAARDAVRAVRLAIGHEMTQRALRFHLRHQGLEHPGPEVRHRGRRVAYRRRAAGRALGGAARRAPWRARFGGRVHRAGWRGWTRPLASWTRTAGCWRACWPSTCRPSPTRRRRPASWPGWTAGRWGSATTRPGCSWTRAGWRSAAGPTSAARAMALCG